MSTPDFSFFTRQLRILAMLCFMVCLTGASVYTWVDDEGNRHFSNVPPVDMFERAEETGLNAIASPVLDVTQEARGRWLMRHGNRIVYLAIDNHMLWRELEIGKTPFVNNQLPGSFRGPVEMSGSSFQVEVWDVNNQTIGQRLFVARMEGPDNLELSDAYGDGRYRFVKQPQSGRPLREREAFLSGQWAQVNPSNEQEIREIWIFDEGVLTRYASRSDRVDQPVMRSGHHLEGSWSLIDNTMSIEYWLGIGASGNDSLTSRKFSVVELGYRRMVLRDDMSREVLVFRRERKK